jgi:UDP-N-acetyl-D-mannosaminuronate dehydrogenase
MDSSARTAANLVLLESASVVGPTQRWAERQLAKCPERVRPMRDLEKGVSHPRGIDGMTCRCAHRGTGDSGLRTPAAT